MKKVLVLMLVVSLMMVGFAACGGGGDDKKESSTGTTTPTTPTTASGGSCSQLASTVCNWVSKCGYGTVPNCSAVVLDVIQDEGLSNSECQQGISELNSGGCDLVNLYASVEAGATSLDAAGLAQTLR